MAIEIERQYVVNNTHPDWIALRPTLERVHITQAVIHRGDGNKLRVRLIDDPIAHKKSAAFTFKVNKKSPKDGPNIRDEYEWEVPYRVALFIMIGHGEVTKTRYRYTHTDGKIWEFDEYTGANTGVILADIELLDEDEKYKIPSWIGQETTKNKKITNGSFTLHPYMNWSEKERADYEELKQRN